MPKRDHKESLLPAEFSRGVLQTSGIVHRRSTHGTARLQFASSPEPLQCVVAGQHSLQCCSYLNNFNSAANTKIVQCSPYLWEPHLHRLGGHWQCSWQLVARCPCHTPGCWHCLLEQPLASPALQPASMPHLMDAPFNQHVILLLTAAS